MELSNREAWTALHGMVLGSIFLLGFGGGLASFWSLKPEWITPAGLKERMYRLYAGTTIMAIAAWLTVLTGTFKVYVWYRAAPPKGTTDFTDYPRSALLANPNLADWHHFGMEWKEHIAWMAPIIATAVAAMVIYYGPRLAYEPRMRKILLGLFVLAFATAAVAGLMGAFITKAAPVL
ncbi:MAG: hypothetical protein ABIQ47_11540 [Tepidiformaceae bacterium]